MKATLTATSTGLSKAAVRATWGESPSKDNYQGFGGRGMIRLNKLVRERPWLRLGPLFAPQRGNRNERVLF
jgi:hypothetical protein